MTEKYLIGVDLGSSFTKAAIFDTAGQALGDAKRDTHPAQPRAGVAEYDGPRHLTATLGAIKELVDKSGVPPADIAAICFVLARERGRFDPEEALLAGLIHDIGAIAVLTSATRYPGLAANHERLERTIRCLAGDVGAMILREWHFPVVMVSAARDAEFWMREHDGRADLTDLVIVAQAHDRLRLKASDELPPVDEIPAFERVLGGDASPQKSMEIISQSAITAEALRGVLKR
jgi:hypothetical protein